MTRDSESNTFTSNLTIDLDKRQNIRRITAQIKVKIKNNLIYCLLLLSMRRTLYMYMCVLFILKDNHSLLSK